MQPFTHPDLIREIHDAKVRDALGTRHGDSNGWAQGAISGVRAAAGRLLIAIGTRLAPAAAPEGKVENVIDLPARRAVDGLGPDDVVEDKCVTDSKPAA